MLKSNLPLLMRALLVLYIVWVAVSGCGQSNPKIEKDSPTVLAVYLKRTAFKPMNAADASNFLNSYIFPGLDTTPLKRQIYIHPLRQYKFRSPFSLPVRKNITGNGVLLEPPPPSRYDTAQIWNTLLLKRAMLVTDEDLKKILKYEFGDARRYSTWQQRFGLGYLDISIPAYNPYTKEILIREYLEDNSGCGTGKDWLIFYRKTATGWKVDHDHSL